MQGRYPSCSAHAPTVSDTCRLATPTPSAQADTWSCTTLPWHEISRPALPLYHMAGVDSTDAGGLRGGHLYAFP